jgi:hypothetical protein
METRTATGFAGFLIAVPLLIPTVFLSDKISPGAEWNLFYSIRKKPV